MNRINQWFSSLVNELVNHLCFLLSLVLFDLFVNILAHNLAEPAYEADVAQLEYKLVAGEHGLVIRLKGFNHKLPVRGGASVGGAGPQLEREGALPEGVEPQLERAWPQHVPVSGFKHQKRNNQSEFIS